MESSRRPGTPEGFSPEFKREFIEKIVIMDKTLADLAEELGVPPVIMRRWIRTFDRPEMIAPEPGEPLVPAIRVLELEHDIEELRRVIANQAMTIQILEKKGTL